jgi:hypothetical protein
MMMMISIWLWIKPTDVESNRYFLLIWINNSEVCLRKKLLNAAKEKYLFQLNLILKINFFLTCSPVPEPSHGPPP